MTDGEEHLPDWERLLAAERHLQHLVPGTVLVGGTAAAIHAGHRVSADGDVLEDLRGRFDDVLATLESLAGWETERVQRPVLILGQLDGILTGIRQLRRTRQDNGASPLAEVAERLTAGAPGDLASVDLATYKGLKPPWNDWSHVVTRGRHWAQQVARTVLEGGE